MKKYLSSLIFLFILIVPFIITGCKNEEFEITTNFSIIEKNVNETILLDDLYKLSNSKAEISILIDNNEILTLNDNLLTCKSSGESNIKITAKLDGKEKSVTILIKVKEIDVYAEEIVCDESVYININEGNEDNFTFSILPNNFNKKLVVESSNSLICDFDNIDSKLIINSVGECFITISAQSSEKSYIEKTVRVVIDDEIYSDSINLLNGEKCFDVFVNSEGVIAYSFDNENVTKMPIFWTNSNLIEIKENGEFKTKNSTGAAEIFVRYYINYFEYKDIQICANIINKINIENVVIYDSNNTPSSNFIVGEKYKYIMEIMFDESFNLSNIIIPNFIKITKVLEKLETKISLEIFFDKADFSSFCIAYNNVSFNDNYEAKFEIKNCQVVDLKDYELTFVCNDNLLVKNLEDKYELFLFDESLYNDDEITSFVEISFKSDLNSLNEFIDIKIINNKVLSAFNLIVSACGVGESKVEVLLFGIIVGEMDFIVKEIKASKITIKPFNNILYVGSELLLDICLDIPYAYNNKIIIEEINTKCLEIVGNKIKVIKYFSDELIVKVSCGELIECINIKVKKLPDRIECYNLENLESVINEIVIKSGESIYLSFKVYCEEEILPNEVIEIKFFSYNANTEKIYEKSDILLSSDLNNEFCDLVCLITKNCGIQMVEFVLKSNPSISFVLKINVEK